MDSKVTIEEGNKLISSFVSEAKTPYSEYGDFISSDICGNNSAEAFYYTWATMKFNSSWDWQVPVWGKIALAVKSLIPLLPDAEENAKWYFRLLSKYENAMYLNKPDEGHKIIVELINWYNQQK